MGFLPFILLAAVVGYAWPSALPAFLAYFILGGALGVFFRWAMLLRTPQSAHLARPVVLYCFYAWPLAIYFMFKSIKPKGI